MILAVTTIGRIFDPSALIFLAAFAGAALIIGFIVGLAKGESASDVATRGFEGMILCFLGGMIARTFILLLLASADNSQWAGFLAGWAFFLVPGAVDMFCLPFGAQPLTNVDTLPWIAAGVGAFAGFMDGLWRIHKWQGPGILTFIIDCTWALVGTTLGCLMHIVNFTWADHAIDSRTGAHRYISGFRFKSGYAVTLGAVMSNMGSNGPGAGLFRHENTHVMQNRVFGPFFSLTYVGWMVFWFPISFAVSAVSGTSLGGTIQGICYFSNPWEAWAYSVAQGPRSAFGFPHTWSDSTVVIASVFFFIAVIAVAVFSILGVYGAL